MYFSYAIFLTDYKKILKNSRRSETVDCSSTSGSELFHARELCAVSHSCQMQYFFQNKVVPQFFNGMVCCHHFQWICGYVHVYKIIKQLFHACSGNSQNYCPSVLESRPQAAVLKSSPAPRVNSFHCSLNRHEITVY